MTESYRTRSVAFLRHDVRVAIDFEAEGLLDGASDRDARLELLQSLEEEGFSLEELREAAAQDRLALLPVERVLAGEGRLYTREELAETTGLDPDFLDAAARALGVPVREPGERAITEEEMELSLNAKTLLEAGLSPEAFLELTASMSRSMQNIAASLTSVFGEAFLQAGDTERDLGLRYSEAIRNLGPLAAPTLQHMLNLRLREQMREAVVSQAELQAGVWRGPSRSRSASWTSWASPSSARTWPRRTWDRWSGASSVRSPMPLTHR